MEPRRVSGGPSLATNSASTLKGRSVRNIGFRVRKGFLLLPSTQCLPQSPQKEWGNLDVADSLKKSNSFCLSITPTEGVHLPLPRSLCSAGKSVIAG
jgi:hypothetical protein